MMKLKAKFKDADLDLFFKVTDANKGKSLSSLYLHTYSLYYFNINTSDSYDETEGQVLRWVTFTYCSRSLANKGKSLPSRYLRTNNLYYFHIKTSDSDDKTQGQVHLYVKVTDADTSWFIQFVSL